jgi:hypothetical protein
VAPVPAPGAAGLTARPSAASARTPYGCLSVAPATVRRRRARRLSPLPGPGDVPGLQFGGFKLVTAGALCQGRRLLIRRLASRSVNLVMLQTHIGELVVRHRHGYRPRLRMVEASVIPFVRQVEDPTSQDGPPWKNSADQSGLGIGPAVAASRFARPCVAAWPVSLGRYVSRRGSSMPARRSPVLHRANTANTCGSTGTIVPPAPQFLLHETS